jgi:hypothetical protein
MGGRVYECALPRHSQHGRSRAVSPVRFLIDPSRCVLVTDPVTRSRNNSDALQPAQTLSIARPVPIQAISSVGPDGTRGAEGLIV